MKALEHIDVVNAFVAKCCKTLADKSQKVRQDVSEAFRHLGER